MEEIILSNLIYNDEYCKKVIPYLKEEYFGNPAEKVIFTIISEHILKYLNAPTIEIIGITINEKNLNENLHKDAITRLSNIEKTDTDKEWLLDKTEAFCKDKAVYNSIMNAIQIYNGEDKNNPVTAIPEILSEALGVSFDNNIGHDYIEDWEQRFDFYHNVEYKIPFDIEFLNKITEGGLPPKSLTCILAGTGVGKSLIMCHMAANNLMQNKKVLYITMEMAQEKIAERIDANLLDIEIADLKNLSKDQYNKKINLIRNKTASKLIVKEFPTASAGVGHFRHLLNELKLKKRFVPDIIYIDYINICSSMRFKLGANINTYSYVKAITEEIRGLAVERKVPIITATQTNREGSTDSDPEMDSTSESFGVPMTLDLMIAVVTNEDLASLNQFLFKQLKNRFSDVNLNKRFVVGVDKAKMRLYDVEQAAQKDIVKDTPVADNTPFGDRLNNEKKFSKKDFDSFR
jgi:replicative DNA helicase